MRMAPYAACGPASPFGTLLILLNPRKLGSFFNNSAAFEMAVQEIGRYSSNSKDSRVPGTFTMCGVMKAPLRFFVAAFIAFVISTGCCEKTVIPTGRVEAPKNKPISVPMAGPKIGTHQDNK